MGDSIHSSQFFAPRAAYGIGRPQILLLYNVCLTIHLFSLYPSLPICRASYPYGKQILSCCGFNHAESFVAGGIPVQFAQLCHARTGVLW